LSVPLKLFFHVIHRKEAGVITMAAAEFSFGKPEGQRHGQRWALFRGVGDHELFCPDWGDNILAQHLKAAFRFRHHQDFLPRTPDARISPSAIFCARVALLGGIGADSRSGGASVIPSGLVVISV
jgi:hypothetical protein